jgi:hypothetical protein
MAGGVARLKLLVTGGDRQNSCISPILPFRRRRAAKGCANRRMARHEFGALGPGLAYFL